jgi:homoserine dehydrogenase
MAQRVEIILFGLGNVGSCVLKQLAAAAQNHLLRYNLEFSLAAVADSNGYVANIPLNAVNALVQHKQAKKALADYSNGKKLNSALDLVQNLSNPSSTIVIDCSATESTIPALLRAMQSGAAITMANKKPLSSNYSNWLEFTAAPRIHRLRYESTVGAGSPFITVCNRLIAANDKINKIQGTFSGTLGFVMSGLERGESYSNIVQKAFKLGYTEPDPRDDLSGKDVARKALILARTIGYKLEMDDIKIEPLYPTQFESLNVEQFLGRLGELDEQYAQKREEAKNNNQVLRYVAKIEQNTITVGLQALSQNTPIGRLQGTENMVEFYTEIYGEKPLVVQGAGAGGEITAAGVIADCIELAGVLKSSP